jgi:hypothetical protein
MKRVGNLWPSVIERGNLASAFHQAARGKRNKMEVRQFAYKLDEKLDSIRAALIERSFPLGHYHVFKVYEPKERTIHAAPFSVRVLHHALMNVCEPVFERHLIDHSYACRKGKGRLKAIAAAERNARGRQWYLKLDIRKYFESIPHDPLIRELRRRFKDPDVLHWLERIIRSHLPEDSRGLPIGSLTSQHLANFYLSRLDRYCQSLPGIKGYVRYMDDFVCWSDSKEALLLAGQGIHAFVAGELDLKLKHPPAPQRSTLGMDFLGYRIFSSHTRLNRRSKVRYRRKLRTLSRLHESAAIADKEMQERLTALTAFTQPAKSWAFRQRTLNSFRSAAIGHEPGDPGRQLEQQRDQLPRVEPQQQQPDQRQQQQQHRVPPGPQLRPMPDGVIRRHQGTEPAAVLIPHRRDKTTNASPRVSRAVDSVSKARGEVSFP